jgi:hypothetical protein
MKWANGNEKTTGLRVKRDDENWYRPTVFTCSAPAECSILSLHIQDVSVLNFRPEMWEISGETEKRI